MHGPTDEEMREVWRSAGASGEETTTARKQEEKRKVNVMCKKKKEREGGEPIIMRAGRRTLIRKRKMLVLYICAAMCVTEHSHVSVSFLSLLVVPSFSVLGLVF